MGNRILKESIRRSPEIDRLSWFEEVVFCRLLTVADDYGRLDGRLVVLLHDLFPTRDDVTREQVAAAIDTMIAVGLLAAYRVDAQPYLYFPTWSKHQTLRHARAKYPPPPPAAECGSTQTAPGSELHEEPQPAAARSSTQTTSRRNLPQTVPPPAAACGSTQTAPGHESPQTVVHEEPQLAAACGATRARAESESEIESESKTSSSTTYAPAGDDDNPFGNRSAPRPSFVTLEAYAAATLQAASQRNLEELASYRDALPEELIRYAIDEACAHGAPRYAYVRTTLNRFIDKGIRTVADARSADAARAHAQQPPNPSERKLNWLD